MTTFLLVPGLFMGGWAWSSVAAELKARGHRAVPLTLPGLDSGDAEQAEHAAQAEHAEDARQPRDTGGAAAIGLTEHIEAVAAALAAEQGSVVLVAHSYGSFPAIAAAERLIDKVERVVFVDTGFPESGEAVTTTMPHLLGLAEGDVLAVPAGIDAVHGVPEEELARYRRLAAPQPFRTVTEPIELTGAWRALPTTGIFCLANGLNLELARSLHATGAPRFAKLAEPGVTYAELNTGHYPMLSTPQELTEALVQAAAGRGVDLWGKPVGC
ncbi:alpha/beta fold hydrolase [Kitasatospora sp. NPDC006697]|uniref:alpha/beta fold hydrolase n=1 Tax=Kitasatospora sp. NPDC006697 TaxID=3364020 RepID=UPI0036D1412B